MKDGTVKDITKIITGDFVLAFDAAEPGCLKPKKVTRVFHNETTEWIELTFLNVNLGSLVTTPGHRFLDEHGNYNPIGKMLDLGSGYTRVISEKGDLLEARGKRIVHSTETADMFEQAHTVSMPVSHGNLAIKQEPLEGWQTYNFEVEDLHTYIAGGVRVHNISEEWAHDGKGLEHNLKTGEVVAIKKDGTKIQLDRTAVDALAPVFHRWGADEVTWSLDKAEIAARGAIGAGQNVDAVMQAWRTEVGLLESPPRAKLSGAHHPPYDFD